MAWQWVVGRAASLTCNLCFGIDVTLTPSRSWANKLQPSLLGLSLRLCDPAEGLGQVWHILDVLEGSPAEVSMYAVLPCCLSTDTLPFRSRRAQVGQLLSNHQVEP